MDYNKEVLEQLTKEEINKDVTKVEFKPWGILSVNYKKNLTVELGNVLGVPETQDYPEITFELNTEQSIKDDDLFTLVMTDPDAPTRSDPIYGEYCHYVETDIKLTGKKTILKDGNVVMKHIGPAPPAGTGLHRYVFLLYKQPSGVNSNTFTKIEDNFNWGYGAPREGAYRWSNANNLELLAANYFLAETK